MRKFQKGQSIVEFALVLPLFFLLLWGFIYLGMFFADYLMLNDVARSCAREASLISASTLTQGDGKVAADDLVKKYKKQCQERQNTTLYQWPEITIVEEKSEQGNANVLVTLKESLTSGKKGDRSQNTGLAGTFKGFLSEKVVKNTFQVEYRMYWEGKK